MGYGALLGGGGPHSTGQEDFNTQVETGGAGRLRGKNHPDH